MLMQHMPTSPPLVHPHFQKEAAGGYASGYMDKQGNFKSHLILTVGYVPSV